MSAPSEVVSCPACRHLLRVPADWLNQPVRCPECKSTFHAAAGGGTELITAPPLVEPVAPPGRPAWTRTIPAVGLMLCGLLGLIVNVSQASDPDLARAKMLEGMAKIRQMGLPLNPADDAAQADDAVRLFPVYAVISVGVFVGGLTMAVRRVFWLAVAGCVLAMVNFSTGCCIPGVVFGGWGLYTLFSAGGRDSFRT